jgi:hypothetical protein
MPTVLGLERTGVLLKEYYERETDSHETEYKGQRPSISISPEYTPRCLHKLNIHTPRSTQECGIAVFLVSFCERSLLLSLAAQTEPGVFRISQRIGPTGISRE